MSGPRNDTGKDGVTYLTGQMLWMDYGFRPTVPEGYTDDEYWDLWDANPVEFEVEAGRNPRQSIIQEVNRKDREIVWKLRAKKAQHFRI